MKKILLAALAVLLMGCKHELEISQREYDNVKTGQRVINDSIVWQ